MRRVLPYFLCLCIITVSLAVPAGAVGYGDSDYWRDMMSDISYWDVATGSGSTPSFKSENLEFTANCKEFIITFPSNLSTYVSIRLQFYSSVAPSAVEFNGLSLNLVSANDNVYIYELMYVNFWRTPAVTVRFGSVKDVSFKMYSYQLKCGGYDSLSGYVQDANNAAATKYNFGQSYTIDPLTTGVWYQRPMKAWTPKKSYSHIVFWGRVPARTGGDFGVSVTCGDKPVTSYTLSYKILYPATTDDGQNYVDFVVDVDCAGFYANDDLVLKFTAASKYADTHGYVSAIGLKLSSPANPFTSIVLWINHQFDRLKSWIAPDADSGNAGDVSNKSDELSEANKDLNKVNKPDPDSIDTDISGYLGGADVTIMANVLAAPLSSEVILPMIMIGLTLCIVAFVFFGKR